MDYREITFIAIIGILLIIGIVQAYKLHVEYKNDHNSKYSKLIENDYLVHVEHTDKNGKKCYPFYEKVSAPSKKDAINRFRASNRLVNNLINVNITAKRLKND